MNSVQHKVIKGFFLKGALLALSLFVGLLVGRPVGAGELPQPNGDVILEVSGKISNTNSPGIARFDLAMLEDLAQRKISTRTRWTEGKVTFEGVRGGALVEALGATGEAAEAVALNEYKVEIPMEDFTTDRLMIAHKLDGKVMSVRDKGPLWVIYDFDSDPELNTEKYLGRSIWQLSTLEFK